MPTVRAARKDDRDQVMFLAARHAASRELLRRLAAPDFGNLHCFVAAGAQPIAFAALDITAGSFDCFADPQQPLTPELTTGDALSWLVDHIERVASSCALPCVWAHNPGPWLRTMLRRRNDVPGPASASVELPLVPRPWFIRPAIPDDAPGICRAHIDSIRTICAPHYTAEQVEAWVEGKTPELYLPLIAAGPMFVAVEDSQILGFGDVVFDPADPLRAEVKGLYLAPVAVGRGIGGAMIRRLFAVAWERGVRRMHVRATTNAAPFYRRAGFVESGRSTHRTRSGVLIPSVLLDASLTMLGA